MALSPAGDAVAVGCDDLTLRLFAVNGAALETIRATRGAFHAISFGRDGVRIAAGTERGDVYVWRAADGEMERRLTDLDTRIASVVFSPEGDRLLAVSAAGEGRSWRLDEEDVPGHVIRRGAGDPVETDIGISIGIDATGRWIVYASSGSVEIVDTSDSTTARGTLRVEIEAGVELVAVSPDGKWLATTGEDGAIRVAPIAVAW